MRIAITYKQGSDGSTHTFSVQILAADAPVPPTNIVGATVVVKNVTNQRKARLILSGKLKYSAMSDSFIDFSVPFALLPARIIIPSFLTWYHQLREKRITQTSSKYNNGMDLLYYGLGGQFAIYKDTGLSEAVRTEATYAYCQGPTDTRNADEYIAQAGRDVAPTPSSWLSWLRFIDRTAGTFEKTTLIGYLSLTNANIQGTPPTEATNLLLPTSWE